MPTFISCTQNGVFEYTLHFAHASHFPSMNSSHVLLSLHNILSMGGKPEIQLNVWAICQSLNGIVMSSINNSCNSFCSWHRNSSSWLSDSLALDLFRPPCLAPVMARFSFVYHNILRIVATNVARERAMFMRYTYLTSTICMYIYICKLYLQLSYVYVHCKIC